MARCRSAACIQDAASQLQKAHVCPAALLAQGGIAADALLPPQYILKRKGQDLTQYGLVDAQAIKRQKLGGDTQQGAPLPGGLTRAMVDDYNRFQAAFSKDLDSRKRGNALDLGDRQRCCSQRSRLSQTAEMPRCCAEDLESGSSLEMLSFFGKLQVKRLLECVAAAGITGRRPSMGVRRRRTTP